jgi:FlaG/FlaF family flagellin (archaellin)/RNA polymerase subunit RPABC4/transcription elongation factor Spt4
MLSKKFLKDESGVNPVFAVIFMVAITVILCGVLYVWVTSLSSTSDTLMEGHREDMGVQAVPVEPTGMEISSILDVEYVIIEGDLLCVYTLHYTATFDYESSETLTFTEIPLPQGSVEDITVRLNGQYIEKPQIKDNMIKLTLPSYRENEVIISYTAFGKDAYNHEIPKNKLIDFVMTLELRGVDYDSEEDLSKNCLTPDTIRNSDDKIVMEWVKPNAILKKDIVIKLPEQSNPLDDYGGFLLVLVLLMIVFPIFYLKSFNRLGLEMKTEYLAFLGTPIIILYMVLGISLVYLTSIYAVPIAMLCYFIAAFITQKKMVPVEKGFVEVLMFPYLMVVFAAVTLFFWDHNGLVVGTVFLILAIIILLNLFRKYKPPKIEIQDIDFVGNIKKIGMDHNDASDKIEKLEQENATLRAIKKSEVYEKRFCQHCGSKIGPKFEFCPICGKGLKKIKQCSDCGIMVPLKSEFCPNCGVGFAPNKFERVEDPQRYEPAPYYKTQY